MQDLQRYVDGYNVLTEDEIFVLNKFYILMSVFEHKFYDDDSTAMQIRQAPERILQNLPEERFFWHRELNYFRRRYVSVDQLNERFTILRGRRNINPDDLNTINEVLCQKQQDPRNELYTLLFIINRLRNNLFHGPKFAYGVRDQKENFENAISIICKILNLNHHH